MRDLAVQAANSGVVGDHASESAKAIQSRSTSSPGARPHRDKTEFNGEKLLDGTTPPTFQMGANTGDTLEVSISSDLDAAPASTLRTSLADTDAHR